MDRINFLKDLNRKYFNGALSTNFLTRLQQLPVDRPDVFSFVERMFNFVRLSGIPAKDLSLFHADVMGTLLARILPGGWGGKIPPITVQGRHAIIDTYIGNNPYLKSNGKTMLDIGCGFPPFTTIEVSNYLKNWKVVGADPSLPAYLVYDEDGNYATFDDTKSIVYFQPAIPSIDNWNSLLSDASSTKKRFEQLLNEFLINPKTEGFPRLEIDPIKSYETEFLSFKNGGIGEIEIEEKDVIRCFNVMYYFDNNFQDKALNWFSQKTVEGGIVMVGGDWAHSTECYYHLFQKESGELRKRNLHLV
ncbi:hypothetical protein [Aegicerativicinus sediminis]